MAGDIIQRADHIEAAIRLAEVKADLVTGSEQMAHGRDPLAHDAAKFACDRALVEVLGPSDPQAAEVGRPSGRDAFGSKGESQRLAVVHGDLGGEQLARIGHVRPMRAQYRDRRPAERTAYPGTRPGDGRMPTTPQ